VPQQQVTPQQQGRVTVQDVALLYYTIARGDFKKWTDLLMNLFGNDPSINRFVFEACQSDSKQKLSQENVKLHDKLAKYTDKEAIIEYAMKEEPGTEVSTQEDMTYFDQSFLAPPPIKYVMPYVKGAPFVASAPGAS
jgi:hypothetical protein